MSNKEILMQSEYFFLKICYDISEGGFMPYAVVAEKLKSVPDYYMEEVSEFIDFILFKSKEETSKNGLDEAIAEVKRGEVEVFNSFEDFKAAMA